MIARKVILSFLTVLAAITANGQVLTDGISGRDRLERYLFIQTIPLQGDTCLVVTDSLGRFEIDPDLMEGMRGNVYLKPMVAKPRPKLVIDSPFDSIDVLRRGRNRYLSQNQIFEVDADEPIIYYDSGTTLLKESVVKAKRNAIARDKVTGYLDSLAILASGEWVCEDRPGCVQYLNDYHGYSHHPAGCVGGLGDIRDRVKHLTPKRGEHYRLVKYEPDPDGRWVLTGLIEDFVYPGPQYTEEELLEMNGMWKVQGYYPKREFYEPDEIELTSPTPDFRNLLQWKPAVLTDENGVAEISFGASDVNTEFIGLVEALDGLGLIGFQTFTFRIIKQ